MDSCNHAEERPPVTAAGPRWARTGVSIVLLLICGAALGFRLPRLAERPLHTDEAVHIYNMGVLWDTGKYIYDPKEYHGPTLYYFTMPILRADGTKTYRDVESVIPFRLVPVIFGATLILLLLFFTDAIGPRGAIIAAILTAVSPAMVFYSRYYIQETLLVFFTFGAIAAGWRYTRRRRLGWALLAGACLGLMHATKETAALAYAAMIGAAALTVVWARWVDGHRLHLPDYFHHWHVAGALKVAAVVSILCLTALLSNPSATLDAARSYSEYFERAAANGGSDVEGPGIHAHPWYYYLQMLASFRYDGGPRWSEGLILLLALAGIIAALKRRRLSGEGNVHVFRFLGFYTILLTAIYSAIPYKTPWCMLGFLHGSILMAGVGASAILGALRSAWTKAAAVILFVAGVFNLSVQAYRGSFTFDADPRNPYVYAHTSSDCLRLVERMEDLTKIDPRGYAMPVRLIAPGADYWPLPWYLRRFEAVYPDNEVPANPDAAVIITKPELQDSLDARLRNDYIKEVFGLRPGILLTVYIEEPLWDEFIKTRQ